MLSYQQLDVYKSAKEFLSVSSLIVKKLPRGSSDLADQLKRASLSILLNIAEGAGKPSVRDAARFYGIARGSAMECGAVLDACDVLILADKESVKIGMGLLERIVAMLSKMCG